MSSSQNTSHAVMAQRREPADSLDDFPTPPWATRALCKWLAEREYITADMDVSEPACNRGYMAKTLEEYFAEVHASDIHDYGYNYDVKDYLQGELVQTDWTITNPPFRLAEEFALRALNNSEEGVALFVRTAFLESVGRYKNLFSQYWPSDVLQFSERVVLHKGKLSPKGSTATAYCWVVWGPDPKPTNFHWIPPCRKQLEKFYDYA